MNDPRSEAAAGMMAGPGMGATMPPELPGAMPEETGAPDVESWIAEGEALLASVDPAQAEEAREHLNAIREIVSGDATALAEQAPPVEELPPEEPKINV